MQVAVISVVFIASRCFPREPGPLSKLLKKSNTLSIIFAKILNIVLLRGREIEMTQKKDHNQIMQNFRLRKSRQFIAIAAAMLLIIFLALLHNRPGLFGQLQKKTVLATQLIVIAAFIGFSSVQLEMPSVQKISGTRHQQTSMRKMRDQIAIAGSGRASSLK